MVGSRGWTFLIINLSAVTLGIRFSQAFKDFELSAEPSLSASLAG